MNNIEGDILSSSFIWKIQNFSSLSNASGYICNSPEFKCFDVSWNLMLYPNGSSAKLPGRISLFLKAQDCKKSKLFMCEISIKEGNGADFKTLSLEKDFYGGQSTWGFNNFALRQDILNLVKNYPTKGTLVISCIITCKEQFGKEDVAFVSLKSNTCLSVPSPLETLAFNLKELYLNKTNCDVIIKVKEKEFLAHKLILGARSSALAATFTHDMKENIDGKLEIEDFEPNIVEDFLLYIYTADIKLSSKNIFDLYRIADKYDVESLKKKCVMYMETNMTVENVSDVICLSDLHEETQLLKVAVTFVAKNADEVLSSDKWETFLFENHNLAYDVLKKIVLKEK